MNFAEFLKLAHILFAIVGFSGAVGLHAVMPMAARSTELSFVRMGLRLGLLFEKLNFVGFLLAGLLGLWLSIYQDWDYGENTWLNISATIWLLAVVGSLIILEPWLRRLNRMASEAPGPDVPAELSAGFGRPLQLLTPNVVTLAMLIVLFLMVAKPGVDFGGIDNWPVNS